MRVAANPPWSPLRRDLRPQREARAELVENEANGCNQVHQGNRTAPQAEGSKSKHRVFGGLEYCGAPVVLPNTRRDYQKLETLMPTSSRRCGERQTDRAGIEPTPQSRHYTQRKRSVWDLHRRVQRKIKGLVIIFSC